MISLTKGAISDPKNEPKVAISPYIANSGSNPGPILHLAEKLGISCVFKQLGIKKSLFYSACAIKMSNLVDFIEKGYFEIP